MQNVWYQIPLRQGGRPANSIWHCIVQKLIRRLLAGLTMVCLSCSSAHAHPQRYVEITAEVELISYKVATNSLTQKRRTFALVCNVGTNEWRIESDFLRTGREVWYFDGTNVYQSIQITKTPSGPPLVHSRQPLPKFLPFNIAKSNLTINIFPSPGGHPLGNLGVNIPWLAFCSGTYLKQRSRVIPLPTTIVREALDAFAYIDEVEAFDDEFGLPKSVNLFTSRTRARRSLDDGRQINRIRLEQAKERWLPPAYPDNTLKFHYQVDESTNVAGWHFPVGFTYTEYRPDTQGRWQPFVGGTGRVTGLHESVKPEPEFPRDMKQTIVDYRFRSDKTTLEAIVYNWTNTALAPPTNDPAVQHVYRAQLKRAPRRPVFSPQQWRWAFGSLVVCSTIVLLMLGVKTSRKVSKV